MNPNIITPQKILNIADKAKNLRLLYVEDNELARKSTLATLEIFFKEITVAVNGEEGLKYFTEQSFDVILTDISMPKMDGIEMISKIRESDENIKIIVLSAHDDPEYFKQATSSQVEAYLLKPINITRLVNTLEATVDMDVSKL